MQRALYILLFMPGIILTNGQTGTSGLIKEIESLRSRIIMLEKENNGISKAIRSKDSIAYCALRLEIFEAFSNAPKLDFDFQNTTEKIAVTGLFTKLMQANNPSSDILGFRFTEIIFSSCEKHFLKSLDKEKDKRRFTQVITKIISNPVVSSLANSNPVTSVVAAIINTIAGFTTSVAEVKKEGSRIKEVEVGTEDVFDQKSITAFRNELQVYINFYDALIIASENYLSGLQDLNTKYAYLIQSVRDYQANLHSLCRQADDNVLIQLATSLPDPARQQIDFNRYITDPEIRKTLLEARKFPALQQSVTDFKKEYNTLLFRFLSNYLDTLETAKGFPSGVVDLARIEGLMADITRFIESQKNGKSEVIDVFSAK